MHNTVLELGRSDCAPSISGVGHQEDDLVGLDPSHDVGYAIINPSISDQRGEYSRAIQFNGLLIFTIVAYRTWVPQPQISGGNATYSVLKGKRTYIFFF